MKPLTGKQTYTTPYVQIGFSKSEAEKEIVEEPLLMSPNPELNEATRTQYQRKNMSAQSERTRRLKLANDRESREKKISDKQSASELPDHWILDEYDDVENDEDVIDYRLWLKEKAKRRVFLLNAERKSYETMTQDEKRNQEEMINEHGLTVEDLVDLELANQEENWRESLADSLNTDSEFYDIDSENNNGNSSSSNIRAIARRS